MAWASCEFLKYSLEANRIGFDLLYISILRFVRIRCCNAYAYTRHILMRLRPVFTVDVVSTSIRRQLNVNTTPTLKQRQFNTCMTPMSAQRYFNAHGTLMSM